MRHLLPALLCLLALALPAQGHPSHTSFAEIGWGEDGTALEISLRVIPEDLENVLGLREGEPIALQDTPEHRNIIAAWLQDAFVISTAGRPLPQELVGLDLGYAKTWVYFTVSADQQQELQLLNTVMHRYNRDRGQLQVNQVQRLWEPAVQRMTFTSSEPQLLWKPDIHNN